MLQSPLSPVGDATRTRTSLLVREAKSAVLGFPLSCRFLIRGEPPLAEPLPQRLAPVGFPDHGSETRQENKNAASRAPFQDRRTLHYEQRFLTAEVVGSNLG
jgi:hypothetical protein